jgi:hypothetical protein
LESRIKRDEQGKGRGKILLSEFLDMAARHRTRIPVSIQAAGRISKDDIGTHELKEVPDFTTIWGRVSRIHGVRSIHKSKLRRNDSNRFNKNKGNKQRRVDTPQRKSRRGLSRYIML